MTVQELLKKTYQKNLNLDQQEIDQILALALDKKIEYLYQYPEKNLQQNNIKTFQKLLKKRLDHWPLAYLAGYKEFFGLKFLVNKHTLIPRPESEMIVEESLKFLNKQENLNVLEIGTGSGCLIISLAKNNPEQNYFAGDISKKALQVARTNARKNKVKINFIHSNLLNKVPVQKFDLILANLPYLKPQQLTEPSIKKEPRLALLSGSKGLDHYEKLLQKIKAYLNKKFLILLEIDPEQDKKILTLVEKYLPQSAVEILPDLAGQNRLVKIK